LDWAHLAPGKFEIKMLSGLYLLSIDNWSIETEGLSIKISHVAIGYKKR